MLKSLYAHKVKVIQNPIVPISALALLSISIYLLMSARTLRLGFPLDDAWIHQTYARNLAERGEWAFTPGMPSAGSTSPLWTLLLAPGHWLGFSYLWWTYFWGGICLIGLGVLAVRLSEDLNEIPQKAAIFTGCFLVIEWHLVWAAVSGMETLLFCMISLLTAWEVAGRSPNWLRLGLFIGICIWVRPDGVTLIGPALFAALLSAVDGRSRWFAALKITAGVVFLLLPYGFFNRMVSGSWLPNTFFAKQAEYALLRETGIITRLLLQIKTLMVGPGALLFPAFILEMGYLIRRRRWAVLGMAIWVIGYLLIYTIRLPVTYQHGRYLIPVMPVYFIWSLAGLQTWLRGIPSSNWKTVLGKSWQIALVLLTLAFFFLGGRAYGQDVAVIESEMVTAAKWVSSNTPQGALIAAHDIGALGFFGSRQLIDLAGLISPEVISFIRDENRIAEYMDQEEVDYLMTFPDWYPSLASRGRLVFDTKGKFSPALGGSNMQIFLWH